MSIIGLFTHGDFDRVGDILCDLLDAAVYQKEKKGTGIIHTAKAQIRCLYFNATIPAGGELWH